MALTSTLALKNLISDLNNSLSLKGLDYESPNNISINEGEQDAFEEEAKILGNIKV